MVVEMNVSTVSLLVVTIFIFHTFIVFFRNFWRNFNILGPMPAPGHRLFIGNLLSVCLTPDAGELFQNMRKLSRESYPIYKLSLFAISMVNILDPRDIQIVLTSSKMLAKTRIYTFLYSWLGTGLLTSKGEKWHIRRKILTPAFHATIQQGFLKVFNDETNKLVKLMSSHAGEVVDIVPMVTQFTLQSITETAMGISETNENLRNEYKKGVYEMGKIVVERITKPWLWWRRFYNFSNLAGQESKIVKVLHDFSHSVIREKERKRALISNNNANARNKLDLLDLLLRAKDKGLDIDYEGVREEVDTFIFEGHDTTAVALTFIMLCLANHPEYQAQVFQEIHEVLGDTKMPSYDDLKELKFTERCIKESMRLFPSVPLISRFSEVDFETATGYTIPKNTIIAIHIFDIHRNENLYPDPLKFDPDRFLPENCRTRHPFAYVPFSAGHRNCIGQRFAMNELKAALCGILRRFELEKIDDMHGVKLKTDLVLRPLNDGIKIKLLQRIL